MNIFATHLCPKLSAKVLDDKRVIKMILESAQLLCNALWVHSSLLAIPYKPTHMNHPCSIWVRTSSANYLWLVDHFEALLAEYQNRYGKIHACAQHLVFFRRMYHVIPHVPGTPFANCTPYKSLQVNEAYKRVLIDKWTADKRKPTWYRRGPVQRANRSTYPFQV